MTRFRVLPRARALRAFVLAAVVLGAAACVKKPTMQLDHAAVSGVQVGFPPSLGVIMTVFIDVYNPNSYDVAIRAVRGQVVLANRYTVPVDYRAPGNGVWLSSKVTTMVGVPVSVPVDLAVQLVREAFTSPFVAYRFAGRADVTATSTFQIEKDDYATDEQGQLSTQQIQAAIQRSF
jgi:hypothetical protein